MSFEFGKMILSSNCFKSNFSGEVGRDISLFEVSQREDGNEEIKKARTDNS